MSDGYHGHKYSCPAPGGKCTCEMSDDKARELAGYVLLDNIKETPLVFVAEQAKPYARVIEYSAVQKLEAQVKELRGDLSKQIAVKTESIGLYGLTLEERDQYKAASEKLVEALSTISLHTLGSEPIAYQIGNDALKAHEKFKESVK